MKLLHFLLILLAIILFLCIVFQKPKTGNIEGKTITQTLNISINGDDCECEKQTCVNEQCKTETDDCGCDK